MIFAETEIGGVWAIDLEPRVDPRGFIARFFDEREFADHGLRTRYVQVNTSVTVNRGTMRGLHWQVPPDAEAKLIRCLRGAVYDVAVDLRPESPTCCRWVGRELTAESRAMLYIPDGFAHGFVTLTDDTEMLYFMSASYVPQSQRGARYDDPAFGISWPIDIRVVSEKDRSWPDWSPDGEKVQA